MGDIVGFCVLYLNLATISNYATRRNNQWAQVIYPVVMSF